MRYWKLYRSFVANCLARTMEFRGQFLLGFFGWLMWTAVSLLYIQVIFGSIGSVRGWTLHEMWVLYGTFAILESFSWGLLGPNMWRFPAMVRDGTLDIALTRPVNTQFLLSTRYIDANGTLNCIPGLALILVGLHRGGYSPGPLQWLEWLMLFTCGFIMAYSIWFCFVTCSIWAVKLDGIAVAIDPMMQMARFPVHIYPRRLQTLLTVMLPVAFLTTFPAQALLGRSNLLLVPGALMIAAFLLWASHRFFHLALGHYSSASS